MLKPLFKALYRLYRVFSWGGYVARRRFTPAGLVLIVSVVAAAMMGPDTDNNVIYQAFALFFGCLAVSVFTSLRFRGRFEAERHLPRFGSVGAPFTYSVSLTNLTRRRLDGLVVLENLADPRPNFHEWYAVQLAEERQFRSFLVSQHPRTRPFRRAEISEGQIASLPPGGTAEAHIELTPERRGLLRFEGLTLARPDVFGMVRAFRRVALPQTALILPRRYPLPPIALPGSLKYQQGGVALASHVGQSDEFVALRDYRAGDPVRHIHWRSWARVGKPVVKEFEDEFFVRHALVLDTFAQYPAGEAFEEAVSVAASFACSLQTQESLLDLLFVGPESFCFTTGRGLAHADQMLEILASVQPCHEHPFRALEHLVLTHATAVSGCICVLLDWDEERREFVRKLLSLGLPVLVLVVCERGARKKLDPGPMRDDPGRFRVLEAGAVEEGLRGLG